MAVVYLHSNTKKRPYLMKSGTAIAKGDLLFADFADDNRVKPAGSLTWNSTLLQTQTDFALRFVGVADQVYDGTTYTTAPNAYGLQRGEVMVLEDGVFEATCASATFRSGTLVGPAKQSGNLLEPQKVVQTGTEVSSIGRVYQAKLTADTTIKFSIHPNLATITTAADTGSS